MTVRLSALLVLALAPAAQGGEFRGRLLADNKPLAGATVSAVPLDAPEAEARREALRQEEPKPVLSVTTKPDGTFALLLPATAGLVRIRVSGGGAVPVFLGRVFDASETDDLGDLLVAKAAALAGKVVDGRGGPVLAATVTLRAGFRGADEWAADAVTTTTGADGSFKFAEAGETGNQLRIEAPGFATAEVREVRAGALRQAVVLALGRAISGSVMLPDRKTPAAGALVRFEGKATTRWAEVRRDGTFLVDGVPAESGSLVADGGEKGRASVPAPEAGAKASLVLAPTAGVRGRVVDATTAAPIAGILVVARSGASTFTGRSGADGRYEVRGLPPGSCRLERRRPALRLLDRAGHGGGGRDRGPGRPPGARGHPRRPRRRSRRASRRRRHRPCVRRPRDVVPRLRPLRRRDRVPLRTRRHVQGVPPRPRHQPAPDRPPRRLRGADARGDRARGGGDEGGPHRRAVPGARRARPGQGRGGPAGGRSRRGARAAPESSRGGGGATWPR